MTKSVSGSIKTSNPTEHSARLLRQRQAYLATHGPYIDYLHLLLDRAWLPASTWAQPNVTNMAAMVAELRCFRSDMSGLNGVVLGRLLHRVLAPLLKWHGGQHTVFHNQSRMCVSAETTIYRFPEVHRGRMAFELAGWLMSSWSTDHDQWQPPDLTHYAVGDSRFSA